MNVKIVVPPGARAILDLPGRESVEFPAGSYAVRAAAPARV